MNRRPPPGCEPDPAKKARPGVGGILGRLLLLLFSLGASLFVAELAIRLVRPQAVLIIPDNLYLADPEVGYRLRPDFRGRVTNRVEFDHPVAINSLGLRGPEIAAGGERLLGLGDSFVFGVGVEGEETLVTRLAEHLGSEPLNAGVPSYGLPNAADWYEHHGEKLGARRVVLGIFLGNDLQDAQRTDTRLSHGFLRQGDSHSSFMDWLYFHSQLFVFLKTAVPSESYQRLRQSLGLGDSRARRNRLPELEIYLRQPSPMVQRGRSANGEALDRLQELTRERGAELVAFLIPTIVQVIPERWQASFAQLGIDPTDYDSTAPTRLFLDLLAERGIPALDLTADLRRAEEAGEAVYYPIDRHWTAAGHRLAAERLAELWRQLETESADATSTSTIQSTPTSETP